MSTADTTQSVPLGSVTREHGDAVQSPSDRGSLNIGRCRRHGTCWRCGRSTANVYERRRCACSRGREACRGREEPGMVPRHDALRRTLSHCCGSAARPVPDSTASCAC